MKANNVEPFYNVHPGGVIKDEIDFRGLSQRQLAKKIGVSYSQLNEVLNEKRALTPEIALLLEATLGIQAQPLMTMQSDYNLREARESKSFLQRLENIKRKRCADGMVYFLEEVRDNRKSLSFQTMYKKKNAGNSDGLMI